MRILLVTLSDLLPAALGTVLNPENEYCAIVVDEPEPAKKLLSKVGAENLVYPFYDLKECIENFHYDCVLCLSNEYTTWGIYREFQKYGLKKYKYVQIPLTNNTDNCFLVERALRYYKEHSAEFKVFATGVSYVERGLDANQFKYKMFNFGRVGQDLYYDYQVAKFVLSPNGGGAGNIRYALIGLAPYSFHYDESKSPYRNWVVAQYLIAFNDVHNFWMTAEQYRSLLRSEFLSSRLSLEHFDENNIYIAKFNLRFMSSNDRIAARGGADEWAGRNFPDTCKENVKILDDYLALCKKNNVRPIIFLAPATVGFAKHFNSQMVDEFYYIIREAQKKNPEAVFVDGWNLRSIDDTDFYDPSHMNIQGAAKFSAILNNVIEQLENQQK